MKLPLNGVKILELSQWLAMPAAMAILADWGAEVVKVENVRGGDPLRHLKPMVEGPRKTINAWWEQTNRNKKSIAIDLNLAEGRSLLGSLVVICDVFATNFMTPVIRRYSLGYEDLKRVKADLIYAHLTGFGKNGPFREKPGFDHVAFWARSGIMNRVAKPGMPPPSQPRGLGDNLTSGFIAAAISAALFGRERTGLGQNLDLSLYHYGVWGLGMDMAFTAIQGMVEPPVTGYGAFNPLTNRYMTGDGVWVQIWCVESDRYWSDFCTALDLNDVMQDPRFSTGSRRMANSSELVAIIEAAFARKTYSEIESSFSEVGEVVFSRVHDPMDVINDDQARAENFFLDVVHPDGGSVRLISSPAKFFGETPAIRKTAPRLSEDADEILASLGLTKGEIDRLRQKKVIL